MATAPGASLLGPIPFAAPTPFADVEVDSGLVSGVPVQLAEENADADLVSALPSAPRPNNGLPNLRFYEGFWLPEWPGLFVSRRGEAKLEALPSPRVMNTHMPLAMIPRAAAPGGGGCKVAYVCRQPKDMVVSRWHFHRRLHPELAFADVFGAVCSGVVAYGPAKTLWDHMLGYWSDSTARPDSMLFLRYEELLRDPAEHVRALARFVGLPFSGAEEDAGAVHDIVKLYSSGRLKNLEANKTGHVNPILQIPRGALFRKGAASDWALSNHTTSEMAQHLDEIIANKLHASGLTFHE
ncbi:hypothetical protein VPH35_005059 [Triticum aestivum]